MKYFWFITIPPTVNNSHILDIKRYMKRSITPPASGIFYILEVVNGYIHTISDNRHKDPVLSANDLGTPLSIHDIAESIKMRVAAQWELDNEAAVNKLKLSQIKHLETEDEGDMYDSYGGVKYINKPITISDLNNMSVNMGMASAAASARKKSRSAKKIKRVPCKCKKNIRKAR